MNLCERVLDAMRSGEWLRSQWIARVAHGLGAGPWQPMLGVATNRTLKRLEARGLVERRDATEHKRGEVGGVSMSYDLPRSEWRLVP